jgi:hypothetical protein
VRERLIPVLATFAIALAGAAPSARADGDPASDYLISQPVFFPFDAEADADAQQRLKDLVASAKTAGFPIKIAIIATAYDLGAVPSLFGKPQRYARFLGQELYYFSKGKLLIVMPQGYGVYKPKESTAADQAVLARLPAPKTKDGNTLVAAADRAVRALAKAHGVSLPAPPPESGTSENRDRLMIAGGAAVLAILAGAAVFLLRRRPRGSS